MLRFRLGGPEERVGGIIATLGSRGSTVAVSLSKEVRLRSDDRDSRLSPAGEPGSGIGGGLVGG